MKKKIAVIFVFVVVGWLLVFGITTVVNFFSWRDDYVEAEPYVEIVWPLSDELKEFEKKNGRRADSLNELKDSSAQNLSKIEFFEHRFYDSGPVVLEIEINETHGFKINSNYSPSWNNPE